MQQVKTTIKQSKDDTSIQWESFELGSRQILFDEKEEIKMRKAIDDLGLEGQKKFIEECDDKIVPFPQLTLRELRIREIFCPNEDKLEDYKQTIIPYEILQIIKLVKQKDYFTKIVIKFEHKDDIDPIVLGVLEGDKRSDTKYFLLCRRGYSLKPFEEIVSYAEENRKKWAIKVINKYRQHCDTFNYDTAFDEMLTRTRSGPFEEYNIRP